MMDGIWADGRDGLVARVGSDGRPRARGFFFPWGFIEGDRTDRCPPIPGHNTSNVTVKKMMLAFVPH